jgi:hypothetical protein
MPERRYRKKVLRRRSTAKTAIKGENMSITGPAVAIIAGAILRFAIHVETWWWAAHGWWISVTTLGDILLIGGGLWLAVALILEGNRRVQARRTAAEQVQLQQHRDSLHDQARSDDWDQLRELERARSVGRMAEGAARRRRDDVDE